MISAHVEHNSVLQSLGSSPPNDDTRLRETPSLWSTHRIVKPPNECDHNHRKERQVRRHDEIIASTHLRRWHTDKSWYSCHCSDGLLFLHHIKYSVLWGMWVRINTRTHFGIHFTRNMKLWCERRSIRFFTLELVFVFHRYFSFSSGLDWF